jgi:hypothetical protein
MPYLTRTRSLTLYGLQDRDGVVGDPSLSFGVAEI